MAQLAQDVRLAVAPARPHARLHAAGARDARARDRRQHRALQRGARRAAEAAAVLEARRALLDLVAAHLDRPLPLLAARVLRLPRRAPRASRRSPASRTGAGTWPATGATERIPGLRVSGNFFEMLGAVPALGRTLRPADDAPGNEKVVVLSHGLWQTALRGRPGRRRAAGHPQRRAVHRRRRARRELPASRSGTSTSPSRSRPSRTRGATTASRRTSCASSPGPARAPAGPRSRRTWRRSARRLQQDYPGTYARKKGVRVITYREELVAQLRRDARDADGRRGPAAAGGVREPRQPDAGARHRAPPGDGHPPGPGRAALAPGAGAAGRGGATVLRRCRPRRAPRLLGRARPRRAQSDRHAALAGHRPEPVRAPVHGQRRRARRAGLRTGAGLARVRRDAEPRPPIEPRRGGQRRRQPRARPDRRGPGRGHGGAVVGRIAAAAELPRGDADRAGLRRERARGPAVAAAQGLPGQSEDQPLLRRARGARAGAARRPVRRGNESHPAERRPRERGLQGRGPAARVRRPAPDGPVPHGDAALLPRDGDPGGGRARLRRERPRGPAERRDRQPVIRRVRASRTATRWADSFSSRTPPRASGRSRSSVSWETSTT